MTRLARTFLISAALISGCAAAPRRAEENPMDPAEMMDLLPSLEAYVGGKRDTGYVGNRAFELEATWSSRVRVMIMGKTQTELTELAAMIRQSPQDWSYRQYTYPVTEQIKYARNSLRTVKLDLNLEGGWPTITNVEVVDGGIDISYSIAIESLVKFKDLESQRLTIQDLVGRTIDARVPLNPTGLFARIGTACASDPDNGADPAAGDVRDDNLFFYWNPARSGCTVTGADLVTGTYRVNSSYDSPTVYPEYDRLVSDGRIDMGVIFGQITHGELTSSDWGFIGYRNMSSALTRKGFRVVDSFPMNRGQRLERRMPSGLIVSVTMLTPIDFADNVPLEMSNERFRTLMRASEILYYNGHAFYGSLRVLDDPQAYPADRYQVLFMDACWSYAYYTKQVFRNRATMDDPTGYRLVDVINNTEPGITGSEMTAVVLYDNMFLGADAVYARRDASIYSWNNIIKYMNDHAEVRAQRRGPASMYPNPEIYGVSGVRTNAWRPGGNNGGGDGGGGSATRRYETTTPIGIADNSAAGASTMVTVPAGLGNVAANARIIVNVEHPYIGDLVIEVVHNGMTMTLHDRVGGRTRNISIDVPATPFVGTSAVGDWTLRVKDLGAGDVGRITRFAVAL